ncbi:MAG: HAD-IA family hydrolase [Actinomycetota bacterium]|nr:HAD-IA family hydrolase [Actinomycetota bacterium]
MPAVLFGSIGTIADTSELQRAAFNDAFAEHGLEWNWSQPEYRELLQGSGGAKRVADYAQARGETVDADAVHATKSQRFQDKLRTDRPALRPGLAETVAQARQDGYKLALVTTTSAENIAALAEAVRPDVDLDSFDLIVDTSRVQESKPSPEVFRYALEQLQEQAGECVAVEDNVGGVQAAVAAGLTCVAFPGENNADHDFAGATERVDSLTFADLQTLASAA